MGIRTFISIHATLRASAQALTERLAKIDPANAAYYQARYKDFDARWTAIATGRRAQHR